MSNNPLYKKQFKTYKEDVKMIELPIGKQNEDLSIYDIIEQDAICSACGEHTEIDGNGSLCCGASEVRYEYERWD